MNKVLAAGLTMPIALGFAFRAQKVTAAATPPVVFISSSQVKETFAKGGPLYKDGVDARYIVIAGRREKPAPPELHERYTEIIYVIEGNATMRTGGDMLDSQQAGRGEKKGSSIHGGETRPLSTGDLLIIPNGTPHQFTEVKAPFLYYAVKTQ